VDSLDQQVVRKVKQWLEADKVCWVCTIVETFGSSPRPVGSLLACDEEGEIIGSLSGGCVEDDLIDRLRFGSLDTARPHIEEYGLSAEENERLGLPCGGRLGVMVEKVEPNAASLEHVNEILSALDKRSCIQRVVDLNTGQYSLQSVDRFMALELSGQQMKQTFGPRFLMLLIGAGQLSVSLAEIAQMLDYRVLVCDPRQQMVDHWPLPEVECVQMMPDDVVRERAGDPYSIIITLTHDPRIDDLALMDALTTDAFYVGALGSDRTTAKRLPRLKDLDLTDQQIAKLHAPVGLKLGSKTPPEIAIAILAELTQIRAEHRKQVAAGETSQCVNA
jgi:xanthine dehydrogenase accessory factor